MNTLAKEIEIVQNPALGALLLWRFAFAYQEHSRNGEGPSLLLSYLVLPLVWDEGTLRHLQSTRAASGLRAFVSKFSDSTNSSFDVLLELHERVGRWKSKTREALKVCFATELLSLTEEGNLKAGAPRFSISKQPSKIRALCFCSEKIGEWFARLSVRDICLILHVRF
jgi:hypothetical protein